MLVLASCGLSGCSGSDNLAAGRSFSESESVAAGSAVDEGAQVTMDACSEGEADVMRITVTVNGETFAATLADTDAAREFANRLEDESLALHLDDYSGFEKVGELGFALTTSDERITTQAGDIVLYKQIADFNYLVWGEMYLVSYNIEGEEYIAVKFINKIEGDREHILLVSHNPHHAPAEIPISSIRALAMIKASVRYNTIG